MHIIFGNITSWQIPILKLLKYIKFKVFYINISTNSNFKRNEIAEKLKKINIFPLPLEKENLPEASSYWCDGDPDEIAYKKNMEFVPDKVLKKYCKLFSLKDGEIKKLRLLLQDVFAWKLNESGLLDIWSAIYPSKKIIYISFKFTSFYMANKGNNITKIIIPLDILALFVKGLKIFPSLFSTVTNKNNLNKDFEKHEIALIPHKGISRGSTKEVNKTKNFLSEKKLYYLDNANSNFNKYNLLHLDYSNFSSPNKNINWVRFNTINVSKRKIFFKTLLFSLKTFYFIRNWSTFLGWTLCVHQYSSYAKYFEKIKKFKNLKIVLIAYDCLCPKSLILACYSNNIKTIATQEIFLTAFYTSYATAVLNTYYVGSEYAAKVIKESKYYDIKNIIPVGQYRSDYILYYKNQPIADEISKAKKNGKKILIVLGNHAEKYWFDSYPAVLTSWPEQMHFLEDMIALSQKLENTFIVLRYKTIDWVENEYFKKIIDKIHNCENITLSNNYEESHYSYKLCAHADLIIAKATSVADECLSKEIPVLFHEYTQKIISDMPNYLPQELMCCNFEELYQKSKTILFSNHSELEEKMKEVNKTIYFVNEEKNIKKKILSDLENQLIENKL